MQKSGRLQGIELTTGKRFILPEYDYHKEMYLNSMDDAAAFFKLISQEAATRDPRGNYDFEEIVESAYVRLFRIGKKLYRISLSNWAKQLLLESTFAPGIAEDEERGVAKALGRWHPGHPDNYGG